MFTTILLDLDGVLKVPDQDWILATMDELGFSVSLEQAESCHYLGIRRFDESARQPLREDYERCYPEGVREALGVPTPQWPQVRQHLLFGAAFRRSMVTPGSADALRAWAAAGLQLAAITQNQRPGAVDWLTHHELTQVAGGPLALVVESSVVGLSKPDPEIVRYALTSLGRNADEAVYVGDGLRLDAPAAFGAGVPFIHLTPLRDCSCAHPHLRGVGSDDLPVDC